MMATIKDVREQEMEKYGTENQQYSDFPIGTRVEVITPSQDFHFFNHEQGKVIRNNNSYLGIIVKFDKKYKRPDFNFEPKDLYILKDEAPTPNLVNEDKEIDESAFRPQEVINRIEYQYKQLDGTIDYPNSYQGDVLKIAYKTCKAILALLDERKKNLESIIKMADTFTFRDGTKIYSERAVIKREKKAKADERKECISVFEQKMSSLGVKWGRIHKADCECGESGCLAQLSQSKEGTDV